SSPRRYDDGSERRQPAANAAQCQEEVTFIADGRRPRSCGCAHGQHKESALPGGYPYSAAFLSTISTPPWSHGAACISSLRKSIQDSHPDGERRLPLQPERQDLVGACTPSP